MLPFLFSSEQDADFRDCSINIIEPVAALFERRRKFGGKEGRAVRSSNHVANNRREAKSGAVLNYRITFLKFGVRRRFSRCRKSQFFRYRVSHFLNRITMRRHQAFKFVGRNAELLCPKSHLPLISDVDAGGILRLPVLRIIHTHVVERSRRSEVCTTARLVGVCCVRARDLTSRATTANNIQTPLANYS